MIKENDSKYSVGFVPHRLEIKDRPELSDFPLNVLFANFFVSNGIQMVASALYKPDVESFTIQGTEKVLKYKNPHREEDELIIVRGENGWSGEKIIKGEKKLIACGAKWEGFFVHLTMSGLSKDEACIFESLDTLVKKADSN